MGYMYWLSCIVAPIVDNKSQAETVKMMIQGINRIYYIVAKQWTKPNAYIGK